ncbi:probable BOI-related E3 ubiquitin-protein ligase 2 isoform X1 [Punica granatum]|uniref:Probable BOI-related E3 ubiquitin-protein ligase 2 isoform X1 n=1 Tax=Punica granatum TaxID=22663 RepID=A0A6P8EAK3_PUNGR|nr:probable BOI-related E3 ubiquitin-protein ligase 2 isoform X1 [Punica granatum]
MAFPQHHFDTQTQLQLQQSDPFSNRNLGPMDGQISPPVGYYAPNNLQDQSQHPPYVPPFHVVGLAPIPVPGTDGTDGGHDLQFNCGLETNRKKLKEQDFFDNNSQISSLDFLQARSVSTGLGLSFDNNKMVSSGDSALLSLLIDDVDRELRQQDAEIERFLKLEAERLRRNILDKIQSSQLQHLSLLEDKVLQKLREKENELEIINRKNMELEQQVEQLTVEAGAWQQQARYNENMISALNYNLQKIYAQSRDSKEGCGDSEVDDTASCCNGRATDLHLLCKENGEKRDTMLCKFCRVNRVCMLLLPCKHLCACRECESKLSFCPLCQSSKSAGVEVFM